MILGGTHQEGDYNTAVNEDDKKFIHDGCIRINKSIKRAPIVNEMVGLRPGRSSVRLERDQYTTSQFFYEVETRCLYAVFVIIKSKKHICRSRKSYTNNT